MTTSFAGIKNKFDLPCWQPTPLIYSALHVVQTAAAGSVLGCDHRASQYKLPTIYFLNSATTLFKYSTNGNGWIQTASPALAGTFGAGAIGVFAPSRGPRGTITTGATTTSIVLSTALPASVGPNQLVNQILRIIDNASGATGKTWEVQILSNTSGTTPTITFAAISNAPTSGSAYEFLTGRYFMLSAGATAAGIWKYYDEACTTFSGNLSTTNLPATIGPQSAIVCLDELHTPITGADGVTAINGEIGGYFGTMTATGSSATTLTGQATNKDAGVLANDFRNFQIRIVQDTSTPTSVGQRRRITSHTAGASPVYTVPTWTVTPSTNAQYVIENNNDIILWTAAATTTYRYDATADAWDTTTYAVKPAVMAAGSLAFHAFGIVPNANRTLKPSFIYNFRGGVTATLDVLDIAAATTGTWNSAVPYDNQGLVTFNASSGQCYSVVDNVALICPVTLVNIQPNIYRFDVNLNSLKPYAPCPFISSTVTDGDRLALDYFVDGTAKKAIFFFLPSTQSYMMRSVYIL